MSTEFGFLILGATLITSIGLAVALYYNKYKEQAAINRTLNDTLQRIEERGRNTQKLILELKSRLQTLENGKQTFVEVSDKVNIIFSNNIDPIQYFLNDNKAAQSLLYDIKRKFLDVVDAIISFGFDNITSETNLDLVQNTKDYISTQYKKSLFAFDKKGRVSIILNKKIEKYVEAVVVLCGNTHNGVRQTMFKKCSCDFFSEVLSVVIANLMYSKAKNSDGATGVESAIEHARALDYMKALEVAPKTILGIQHLEARYKMLKLRESKGEDLTKKIHMLEIQILSALLDEEKA